MKNISLLALSLGIVVFFSSCSQLSDITFTKRHYRKGYYINLSETKINNTKPILITEVSSNTKPVSINLSGMAGNSYAEPSTTPFAISILNTPSKNPIIKRRRKREQQIAKNSTITQTNNSIAPAQYESVKSTCNNFEENASKNDSGVDFTIIIICTIFIPPLGVALTFGIDYHFWIDLILTLLFFIPGLIYGLIVVLM